MKVHRCNLGGVQRDQSGSDSGPIKEQAFGQKRITPLPQ